MHVTGGGQAATMCVTDACGWFGGVYKEAALAVSQLVALFLTKGAKRFGIVPRIGGSDLNCCAAVSWRSNRCSLVLIWGSMEK